MISGMASDDPSFVADLLSALELHSGGREEKKDTEVISRRYADMLLQEQSALTPDKMAVFKGVVKNKRARWNLTFGDTAQVPNYAEKKGTIVPFSALPRLGAVRDNLEHFFGKQAAGLRCEGNYYYDKTCGIGFHGDGERRIVIAVRLGDTIPLVYQWYLRHKPQGKRVDFALKHGSVYAMSGKAVGTDWMSSSFPTLRHAAGAAKYITPQKN
jgi:alkylated DNA repair dioxygenase AlkB